MIYILIKNFFKLTINNFVLNKNYQIIKILLITNNYYKFYLKSLHIKLSKSSYF